MESKSMIRRRANQDPAGTAAEIISLRAQLAESHKSILKLGEESLRDQEKLREAEKERDELRKRLDSKQ